MQDSIEDYIRISRNLKDSQHETPPIKKEALISAQLKKESNSRAMQILQFAIEGKMRSDALFRCLPYVNQSHYQDIVEERAITKLCGYPLCSKRIPQMPKKQFFISTKNNKVYDIKERKNFCSNYCYRASLHIKNQIDNSPLWLRKIEDRTQFTLLQKTEKGLPGELVDQGFSRPLIEPRFTSISTFTEMSLDEAEELEMNPQEQEEKKLKTSIKKPRKYQKSKMKTINENEEEDHNEPEIKPKIEKQKIKQDIPNKPTIKQEIDIESHIFKCFKEWLTLETYIFIYGEEKVKEKLDNGRFVDYLNSLKITDLQVQQQKKYLHICKKLHLQELAEENFDKALKPLPDYRQLKEQSKELDLKIKSFYLGELHIQENSNFPIKNKIHETEIEDESGSPAVLPLVDSQSQNALRRKIFLNSLNRTIHNLFETLSISPHSVLSDLQSLVKTFKLKPDNIVFKPMFWEYITVILLEMLAIKDDILYKSLQEERAKAHLDLVLSSLPHKRKLIDDVLTVLQDINVFVRDYIISVE